VKKLTKHLCPNAHGKINFKDFCHAVFAIKGFEEILKIAVCPRSLTSRHQSVTDNGYIYQVNLCIDGDPDFLTVNTVERQEITALGHKTETFHLHLHVCLQTHHLSCIPFLIYRV
ncbi:hypothetical protein AMECASPLE_012130, partial [Ameca splendens]